MKRQDTEDRVMLDYSNCLSFDLKIGEEKLCKNLKGKKGERDVQDKKMERKKEKKEPRIMMTQGGEWESIRMKES